MVTVEEKAMEYSGALERLLGAENLESVRKRIADLIVKQVEDDFRSCGEYFFYPPNYECIIDDAIASVEKKISKMYKDASLEIAEIAVNKFKDEAISSLERAKDDGLFKQNCYGCKNYSGNECNVYGKRICIANRECREDKYVHRIEKSESSRNRSHLVVDLE